MKKLKWEPAEYSDNSFVANIDQNTMYQVHSASRHELDEDPNFVSAIWSNNDAFQDGYLAKFNGIIKPFMGNGMFCAMGVPDFAKYSSIDDAKKICEQHYEQQIEKQ